MALGKGLRRTVMGFMMALGPVALGTMVSEPANAQTQTAQQLQVINETYNLTSLTIIYDRSSNNFSIEVAGRKQDESDPNKENRLNILAGTNLVAGKIPYQSNNVIIFNKLKYLGNPRTDSMAEVDFTIEPNHYAKKQQPAAFMVSPAPGSFAAPYYSNVTYKGSVFVNIVEAQKDREGNVFYVPVRYPDTDARNIVASTVNGAPLITNSMVVNRIDVTDGDRQKTNRIPVRPAGPTN